MKRLFPIFLLLLITAPAVAQPLWPDLPAELPRQGGGAKDAAVVIGIGDYAHLPDVPGAAQNARDWERWLLYGRQVNPAHVTVLVDDEALDGRIERAVQRASDQVEAGGTLWFVFIGHGVPRPGARVEPHLVSQDATRDLLFERSVPQRWIEERLGRATEATAVMVVDACFTGQGTATGAALAPDTGAVLLTDFVHTEVANLVRLSAGDADDFANSLPGLGRPAFSYLVLGGLLGWADTYAHTGNRDGRVTVAEAVGYGRAVLGALPLPHPQEPQMSSGRRDAAEIPLAVQARAVGPDILKIRASLDRGTPGRVTHGVELDRGEDIVNEITDETGFLVIRSDPEGATITLNGEAVGTTPLQVEKMVGRYVVVAEMGRLYHPTREELRLGRDGATRIDLALAPAFGTLAVSSDPTGAEVWLDGEMVGTTPYRNPRKPSGEYHLRVVQPDYLPHETTVAIRDGLSTAEHTRLVADFGALSVSSDPPGARILLDGVDTGLKTPHRFPRVKPGAHQVRLELEAHGTVVERPSVDRGGEGRVAVRLDPKLGLLAVVAQYADGTPCEGELRVDGHVRGRTPAKLEVLAKAHDVEVTCAGYVARRSATVQHNARADLALRVAAAPPGTSSATARGWADTTVRRAAPQPARERREPWVYLGLTTSMGALLGGTGDVQRTRAGLELAAQLRFDWFRADLGLSLTVEEPVAVVLRSGLRADLGPAYFRTGYQFLATPLLASGWLFAFGGEVPLPSDWFLVAEVDASLWFQQPDVVPLEGRLGVRYGF